MLHQRIEPKTGYRESRSHSIGYATLWMVGLALTVMVSLPRPGLSQPANENPIAFSIPAQPLGSALDRYGDTTGREAFYDAVLAAGLTSAPVEGSFTPNQALERLLAGTGLSPRYMADNSFVLLPAAPAKKAMIAASPAHRRYYAVIQLSLRDAFCHIDVARPGRYRFVALFWIGPTGAVERARRLGSVGTPEADQRIDAILAKLQIAEPPPVGFEQPVLMMVVPQAIGVTQGCDGALQESRSLRSAR